MATLIAVVVLVAGIVAWAWSASYRVAARPSAFRRTRVNESGGGLADEEDQANAGALDAETPAARDQVRSIRASQLSSLGDLAGGIAHEINNPVAIMVEEAGWIEDLLEEEEFRACANLEEVRRALREIRTQGRRCKDITSNLLSFARHTRTEPAEVQLNDVVRDVVRDAARRVPEGVTVEAKCEPGLPPTWTSASEMQQVLVNLVNNALDALEGRQGRVDVSTALDGPDITMSVADSGAGIPAGDLARIFDPFFTTKPVGSGTGLGLSICYGIVARLGGDIAVTTAPGAGSTFTVRIPRRAADGAARPATTDREAGGLDTAVDRAARGPQKPVTVLIVDHEAAFVEALRRRLVHRQVDVLAARSGPEALSLLTDNQQIDVVLLDVQLPGADSLDTLRGIKAVRPLVEVLLVSSHTTFESAIEGMRLGAFDYLLKPCDMAPLLSQIRRAKARKDRQEHRVVEARIKGITLRRP